VGSLLLAVFCSGCVSLERSYPEKRLFVIELQPSKGAAVTNGQVLSLPTLHISPRYADRDFVYRTSQTEYESDFYNQFLIAPAVMITEEARKALAASSGFKFVVGPASPLTPNYVLEGSINALYGDFRNPAVPAAVLEIEFFLHNENPANQGIALHKRYMQAVALKERSPEALVRGWSEALQAIVAMFVNDSGLGNL
jgi:cholesterol transport system auxiliary component